MRIDFHTHSTASDGALSPAQLLARASARDITLLAITDHDTVSGFEEARLLAAGSDGLPRLVPGIEYSCRWSGVTIHVLGLGMNCEHPAMREGLAQLASARRERGEKTAAKLEALGFAGALDGALARAGESQLGRPHFAAWLVDEGHVPDISTAFDKYLGQGKVGDIKAYWPELSLVVHWITAAGGVAIIAHPLKYKFTRMKLSRLIIDFKAAGGQGLEIASGRQTPDQIAQLCRLAREYELEVSLGSDFHRDGPYHPDVGVDLPRIDGLRGVWQRFLNPPVASTGA
ncbi:MAG: PHP domain-containing protein [Pseudomonadota bacterium]